MGVEENRKADGSVDLRRVGVLEVLPGRGVCRQVHGLYGAVYVLYIENRGPCVEVGGYLLRVTSAGLL